MSDFGNNTKSIGDKLLDDYLRNSRGVLVAEEVITMERAVEWLWQDYQRRG